MWLVSSPAMRKHFIVSAVSFAALISGTAAFAAAPSGKIDYFDIPLEELMNIEVTSVSKKKEKAREAPAALYVITSEDIRRSGANSIPEALRGVPGIKVSQIDSSKWSVSARSGGGQFSNSLLVMIDGRSVYTPGFSGVYWDVQDTILEDIERIEVIRGPGATVWGANAVNGVINIITKSAEKTQGKYASLVMGTHDRGILEARYGGKAGDNLSYRSYVKYTNRDEVENSFGQDNNDAWEKSQAGFRTDWDRIGKDKKDSLTVSGDIYYESNDFVTVLPTLTPPFSINSADQNDASGGNILGKWNHFLDSGSNITFQAYFDHANRNDSALMQEFNTVDLDFQHNLKTSDRNEVVWGAGYRLIWDNYESTQYITMSDPEETYDLWSAFIQDEYYLIPEKLSLTLGSKFEHNDYSAFEYQPSAKILWNVDNKQTIWASISRAVRTPSRSEDAMSIISKVIPPNIVFPGSPIGFSVLNGTKNYESEKLMAYEVGYRAVPVTNVSFDLVAGIHRYSELLTGEIGTINPFASPFIVPAFAGNKSTWEAYGMEASVDWKVLENWNLELNLYSLFDIKTKIAPDSTDRFARSDEPNVLFNIRSQINLPRNVELDNILYYVDDSTSEEFNTNARIPNYWRFDTRIGWQPTENLELSLVGQNLLEEKHIEAAGPLFGRNTMVDRSIFGKVTLRF